MWHNVFAMEIHTLDPQIRFMAHLHLDLETIEAGIPVATMTSFASASGIQLRDIYSVVIPARTLKHRRSRKEPLTPDESDKLARLVRIYDLTVQVFGDREKAIRWLNHPKQRYDARTPLQMLRTELGGRMVEEMLIQIDEGMFA